MTIQEQIAALKRKKKEIHARVKSSTNVDEVRRAGLEIDEINDEIEELELRMEEEIIAGGATPPTDQRSSASPIGRAAVLASFGMAGHAAAGTVPGLDAGKLQERGAKLKQRQTVDFGLDELPELRAVTIGSGKLVVPTHSSNTLNPAFNEVSSVIDVVHSVPLVGGESYNKGFIIGSGEGDYTTETDDYKETDPQTDFVNIGKAKITAYTELSDESAKLPDSMYQQMVLQGIQTALRKKIAKQIVAGAGGANAITGIFNAPANVIPTASDLAISGIDETTLDKIVFGYGGDESVEGGAYLILSKADLAAFAAIRDGDGRKLYKITLDQNGNTGTISSSESYAVRYIINSACAALSASGTAADTYCMAYGKPLSYELPMFSPVTVEESRDFKFKSGQICYRGSVWVGGNVASYKGFTRIKKATAV